MPFEHPDDDRPSVGSFLGQALHRRDTVTSGTTVRAGDGDRRLRTGTMGTLAVIVILFWSLAIYGGGHLAGFW